jgi:hypothetical protein
MTTLGLVLFVCAGLLVIASLSSLYVTNVTFWEGHTSRWTLYLGIAALLLALVALLIGL